MRPRYRILRRIFRIKIPPSLKWLFQSAVHRHQLRIEHQHGAFGTIVTLAIDDIHDTLARRDNPVDHPVQRPPIQQLLSPPWKMPRAMPCWRIRLLPSPYIINALTAHGEFDKMHSQQKSPDKIKVFCFFSSEKKVLASWNVARAASEFNHEDTKLGMNKQSPADHTNEMHPCPIQSASSAEHFPLFPSP
jgi:hypothetical protein